MSSAASVVQDSAAAPLSLDPTTHQAVQQLVHELPDACERLAYVKQMTAQAANTVLGLVESAQGDAEQVRRQGRDLSESLARLATSPELTIERARSMMKLCAAYAATAASFAEREKALHTEIMMAQGFQDLSGQVINKVSTMLTRSEQPLMELLERSDAAAGVRAAVEPAALEGVQTPDKALKQDDVDDLLASLGF